MSGARAYFSPGYRAARERFLRAAQARGASLEQHLHPSAHGREGEPLAVDVATLGPSDADAVVLLQSGTHGVEGYCGSGVQLAVLDTFETLIAETGSRARLVLLHALNPYGFSHGRRTNEDNVDLNRNFVDPARAATADEDDDYAQVHPLLLPPQWPWPEATQAAIAAWIAQHGIARWQHAITHGQRSHPDGLFYAGREPAWSNRVLRDVLRRHVAPARRMYWIDVHTGLGPSGVGEMIHAGGDDADAVARARACWGPGVTSIFEGSSSSARIDGFVGLAAADECPRTAFAGIALEFGTLPLPDVLEALRFEQWVRNHAPGDAALLARARDQLHRAFFVDTDEWCEAVVAQGLDATRRALAITAG